MPRDTTDGRVDPDALLKAIEHDADGDEEHARRGHLKIFFGYAAGVGKTYAMLQAAHAAKRRGVDVVAGYIEPHERPATARLVRGLEQVPPELVEHNGITLTEFDLDAAIVRAPQLILVDELAHTNAPGCRHAKRYQDVEELLRAGIDVYTTVNVQHIESLNDMVASITGVVVRERIPDRVFDDADQVELMDIEPADLLERLQAGLVYREAQAERAQDHFFTVENLTALREIALRKCADRMGHLADAARVMGNRDYYTSERILVCVSPAPTNPRIVRAAARMAKAFRGELVALFVEGPHTQGMSEEEHSRLSANIALAEQLGAHMETVYGDDIAFQIAEFARLSGISKIVMGRTGELHGVNRALFGRKSLVEQLIAIAPNLDIYIIPDQAAPDARRRDRREHGGFRPPRGRDMALTLGLSLLATAIGTYFRHLGFADSSIISLYILTALLTAVTTTGRICTIVSSVLSVVLYNFCFVTPLFSLDSYDRSYLVTFAIMFATAMVASELTVRIADNARASAKNAFRTRVLLETNQLLQQAQGFQARARVAMSQLIKLLRLDIVFYPASGDLLGDALYEPAGTQDRSASILTEYERAVATWTFTNNKHAGASTRTLPEAQCLYLAVRAGKEVFGVIGIALEGRSLEAFENSIVLSIVGECALALESDRAAREREEAAVLAKNEQLRANLLRSIGHDLRTPLTAISGSAAILRKSDEKLSLGQRCDLADAIYHDSLWLIDTVENLLAITRVEDGTIRLNLTSELIDEVIEAALSHVAQASRGRTVTIEHTDDILLVRIDVHLIMQVLTNLIMNAFKYTPEDSTVTVSARREGAFVVVDVADDGPGVPDCDKPHIFERFFTSSNARPVDSRRSIGLGLSLCRSIVEAHGGVIEVRDNHPHGAVFRFTLPAEEIEIHE
ncbi:MAG TPA: sensor histidine kinase KdpD [Coriobacteriaceae bacterium]|nr:sensor histidine kinase KdpD [Coriobacteriaceae bacterium]